MVALNRVQKLLASIMDVVISEATLLKFILRVHQALEAWEAQAVEQILKAPVMNVDDDPHGCGKCGKCRSIFP